MLTEANFLLYLLKTNEKQIPRFALHHTVRGFARDDMIQGFSSGIWLG
jgi:hypothetical protein